MAFFIIDCGHGGEVPARGSTPIGVVGASGVREKDVTLAIGRRLARQLGPDAVLTRSDDRNLTLGDRQAKAARFGAGVFVSVHANEGPPGRRGTEAWIHDHAGAGSHRLATLINQELARLGAPGGGGVRRGDLALLRPDRLPAATAACLVEVDYLSDPDGARRLSDPRALDGISAALARALRRYGRVARALNSEWVATCYSEPQQPGGRLVLGRFPTAVEAQAASDAHHNLNPAHRIVVSQQSGDEAPLPEPPPEPVDLPSIFFDHDSDVIRPDQRHAIDQIVDALIADPRLHISLLGHASPDGEPGYNHNLSVRRAWAVEDAVLRGLTDYAERQGVSIETTGRVVETNGVGEQGAMSERDRRVDVTPAYY